VAGRPADTPQSANFLTNRKNHMEHDKTFEAINKLKDIEIELHRLKNALEMANKSLETKDEPVAWEQFHEHMAGPNYVAPQRTWVDLTDDEMLMIYGQQHEGKKYSLGRMVQQALKEKNT
jgi:hypothetical protein